METVILQKPEMPLLRETADQIYQRIANRAIEYNKQRGLPPPAVAEGEDFYDLWYPLAEEWSEQQQVQEYEFMQGFVVWADGEFLTAHGYAEGVDLKENEDEETYRRRILAAKRTEEGSGRARDYETWAGKIEGVGGAVAIEHERNTVSIDLYLTDMDGDPTTPEFTQYVRDVFEEKYRVAGHDLLCHPAEIFDVDIEVKLTIPDNTKRASAIALIEQRQKAYLKGRTQIVYQQLGSLFWVDGVVDFSEFTLNGGEVNLTKPIKAVSKLNLVVLP